MAEALPVRLSGVLIGEISAGGSFDWITDWQEIAPLNSRILSYSLPFGAAGQDPAPFFGGLLPEGAGLERLAREVRVRSSDLHGLLAEVGADVGGAVTIGEPQPPLEPIPIPETEFEGILARAAGYLRGSTVGGGGSSATGVQQKIALTLDAESGEWLIGRGSTPSTHLLKPVAREYGARIRAEAYLSAIARSMGLSSHETRVVAAGARDVLVVERYDRRRAEDGTIVRLHQEDAAQALGLPWGGNDKYESVNARASLRGVASLLGRHGSIFDDTPSDLERLLAITVLNVVAGNTDAHAKNFSLILPELSTAFEPSGSAPRLADAYDIVPQSYFTAEPDPLAMRINGVAQPGTVTVSDLIAEGASWGLAEGRAERAVRAALGSIIESLGRIESPAGTPTGLPQFLSEQAGNLLRGDRAWTRALPPALVF